jgi:hypothetical protein
MPFHRRHRQKAEEVETVVQGEAGVRGLMVEVEEVSMLAVEEETGVVRTRWLF